MGRVRRGLTLAEILIAVAVASVALLTMVLFTSVIHRAAREGKSQATASTLARTELERLRADPQYLRRVQDEAPFTVERTEVIDSSQRGRLAPTVFTVEITLTPLSSNDHFLESTVLVHWNESHRQRQVSLHSYLPDPFK